MLPLEIFNEIFSKYVSTIGNLIGFNILNPDYKITVPTAFVLIIISFRLICHIPTLILCTPPRNVLNLGESMRTLQVGMLTRFFCS